MTTGTNDISTLLASRNQSIAAFGLTNIIPILNRELAAHNQMVRGMLSGLATFTTDRQRKYGTSSQADMYEVDEYGRAPTQVAKPGDTAGFPLKLFQTSIGWTDKWFQIKTPADMAIAVQAAERAHLRMYSREIKRAFMLSANYSWNDFLVDGVTLAVKRLVNADGGAIPEGPNNEIFDPNTHTHYAGTSTLVVQNLLDLINNVVEHGQGTMVQLDINKGNEAAVRALTGFTPYIDPRITLNANANSATERLDYTKVDNRAIGLLGGAEVWVKPWMPLNYYFCYDTGSPPPLVVRQRDSESMQGLRIVSQNDAFPLHAQFMEAEFGIAVWNRTNGAMLLSGNASYQDPSITS